MNQVQQVKEKQNFASKVSLAKFELWLVTLDILYFELMLKSKDANSDQKLKFISKSQTVEVSMRHPKLLR